MSETIRNCNDITALQTPEPVLGKVCIFKHSGEVTLQSCAQQIQTMVACFEQEYCNRFLVDATNAPLKADIASQYFFAYEQVEKLHFRRSWKIALLIAPEDSSREFLETAIRNAGYALRCFEQREAAMTWLLR